MVVVDVVATVVDVVIGVHTTLHLQLSKSSEQSSTFSLHMARQLALHILWDKSHSFTVVVVRIVDVVVVVLTDVVVVKNGRSSPPT